MHEFICPEHYNAFGEKSIRFIDERIVIASQFLRDRYGRSTTINNWRDGGPRKYSGTRPFNCTTGATYSQHKYGRATDNIIEGYTPAEIRDDIIKHQDIFLENFIYAVESGTPTWTHIDCQNTGLNEVVFVPFY